MKFLCRLFLSAVIALTGSLPAYSQETYFFRYGPAVLGPAGTGGPGTPVTPVDPSNPDDFDVFARFFGVVGVEFDSTVPTKTGAPQPARWSVERGTLPEGIGIQVSEFRVGG